jgi:hypothetical protein
MGAGVLLLITKKTPAKADAFLVEHLQKSSPLIFEEIRRWRYLIWDDYVEYRRQEERKRSNVLAPSIPPLLW